MIGISHNRFQNEASIAKITANVSHHQITIFLLGIVANSFLVRIPKVQPSIKNKPTSTGINSI
jgi:hypothetical protein